MMTTTLALSMSPIDWGLSGAAILLLIFAARTFVTGEGKSQMGFGFMLVAAVVWTFAIGRQIDDFSTADMIRVAIGILLLVPVFRVLFTHTSGSVTSAVISLILSSVIAGPVLTRAFPEHIKVDVRTELNAKLGQVDKDLETATKTRDSVFAFAAKERETLDAMDVGSREEIEANPMALESLERYMRYKEQIDSLGREEKALKREKESLQNSLAALDRGADHQGAMDRAAEIRAEVEAEAARRMEKSDLERYTDRAKMLELFEEEFTKDSAKQE